MARKSKCSTVGKSLKKAPNKLRRKISAKTLAHACKLEANRKKRKAGKPVYVKHRKTKKRK